VVGFPERAAALISQVFLIHTLRLGCLCVRVDIDSGCIQ
jgi:hypothetical protein